MQVDYKPPGELSTDTETRMLKKWSHVDLEHWGERTDPAGEAHCGQCKGRLKAPPGWHNPLLSGSA